MRFERTITRQSSIKFSDDTIHVESEKPAPETGPDSLLRAKMQRISRKFNLRSERIREVRETSDQGEDRTRAETGF